MAGEIKISNDVITESIANIKDIDIQFDQIQLEYTSTSDVMDRLAEAYSSFATAITRFQESIRADIDVALESVETAYDADADIANSL